jgi:hypothetical protein
MAGQQIESMTEQQAYRAMLKFLERHYDSTGADDIASLLGSMSLLNDGQSADPAMRKDWHRCAAEVIAADSAREAAE